MFPLWNFFLTRKQFSFLLFGILAVWGLFLAFEIQKESAPEVQIPVGVVSVALPGGAAEDVERLITNKIEARIAGLSNLQKVTSTSSEGLSTVVAEFAAGADITDSVRLLRDEVEKVRSELPTDATDPVVSEVNFVDQPIMTIAISSDTLPQGLSLLADEVSRALEGISSVSRAEVSGVRAREVHVLVRAEELVRYGMSFNDVVSAIRASNASAPAGSIVVEGVAYPVRFTGALDDPESVANIPILAPGGSVLYLRDIADVVNGVARTSTFVRLSEGGSLSEQALVVSIYKNRTADVTRVSNEVRAMLERLEETLLSGSSVAVVYDSGELVEDDLSSLVGSGLITVFLVMTTLIITIGWREAIIAGLAIPLSFLLSFIGLFYSGNTINFISLFSLILAVGILVDAGIVIVEAMVVRLRKGLSRLEAAQASLREFAWPLIAGTATTVAVFVPLFFISGVVGQFIASIPFTIIFVLIAAQIVALAILPLLVITFSKEGAPGSGKLGRAQAKAVEGARTWYQQLLEKSLGDRVFQTRFLVGISIAFVVALLLPAFGVIKSEFFPGGDAEYVYVNLELPQGTMIQETDLALRALEEIVYDIRDIENFVATSGASSAFSGSGGSGPQVANILLILSESRSRNSTAIVEELREKTKTFEYATVRIGTPEEGPPTGAPITVKFFGDSLDDLALTAAATKGLLESIPGVVDVSADGENAGLEFVLESDRARFASVGLMPSLVAQNLRTAVEGTEALSITTLGDDIRIMVRANLSGMPDPEFANYTTIDALRNMPLISPSGEVLLGSLTTLSLGRTEEAIRHEDRQRVFTVSAHAASDVNILEVVSVFRARAADELTLPAGVSMEIGGENEEVDESFKEMFFALIAGILLMFGVVVLLFNSFRLALYTLLTVPLTLIGVMAGLLVTMQPVSFPVLLGIIALAGVVINNAIVLVHSFVHALKEAKGASYKEVLVEASVSRMRPVLLTAITTVVGMVPLLFAAAIWAPLAYTIMFGLIFATILTLLFIPILLFRAEKHVRRIVGVEL